jgi:hypothetical protein
VDDIILVGSLFWQLMQSAALTIELKTLKSKTKLQGSPL